MLEYCEDELDATISPFTRCWSAELLRYAIGRLRTPRKLDALSEVLAAMLEKPPIETAPGDPVARLSHSLRASLQELARSQINGDADRRLGLNSGLRAHIAHAVQQLPSTHQRVLLKYLRSGSSSGSLLRVADCATARYLSQARALIRAFAIQPEHEEEDTTLLVVSRRELLLAQEAAEWLRQIEIGSTESPLSVFDWLRRSPLRARELLLAMTWDAVLRATFGREVVEPTQNSTDAFDGVG